MDKSLILVIHLLFGFPTVSRQTTGRAEFCLLECAKFAAARVVFYGCAIQSSSVVVGFQEFKKNRRGQREMRNVPNRPDMLAPDRTLAAQRR
jgi:hypothetical protein